MVSGKESDSKKSEDVLSQLRSRSEHVQNLSLTQFIKRKCVHPLPPTWTGFLRLQKKYVLAMGNAMGCNAGKKKGCSSLCSAYLLDKLSRRSLGILLGLIRSAGLFLVCSQQMLAIMSRLPGSTSC